MTNQLTLIDTAPEGRLDWRLDERTRRVGRQGIAEARAALAAGRRAHSADPPDADIGAPGSATPTPPTHRSAA